MPPNGGGLESRACARRLRHLMGRRPGRGGGGRRRTPLSILLAAPGADVFYDADYLAGITKDGSSKVSAMMSRIGGHTVEQATAGNQPTWGATSPSGRLGITFVAASNHRLVDPLTTLGALYDAVQAYSALWVVKFTTAAANQAVFGFGDSGSSANTIVEGTNSSSQDVRIRTATSSTTNASVATHSTTIVCVTSLFTGGAYSSWLNGSAALSAAANVRSPTCDQFCIGARRLSGAFGLPFGGEFYGLILSRSQWSTGERQTLEAAAKAYWGTP